MKRIVKYLNSRLISVLILVAFFAPIEAVAVDDPYAGNITDYSSNPPFLPQASDPNILFLLDTSYDMLRPAYGICNEIFVDCRNNFLHTNDDYDKHIPYYGPFDNGYSHLEDEAAKKVINDAVKAAYGDSYRYDDSYSHKYTATSVTIQGVKGGFEKDDAGLWNGNWLNWLAMTQFDLMKEVAVGGFVNPSPEGAQSVSAGSSFNFNSPLEVLRDTGFDNGLGSATDPGKIYKVITEEKSDGRLGGYANFTTPQEIHYKWIDTPTSADMDGYSTLEQIFGAENTDDEVRNDPNGLPFAFKLYTTSYAAGDPLYISSNGVFGLSTSLKGFQFSNNDIPDAAAPNSIIALHWDDLYVSTSGTDSTISTFTIGEAPNRIYVVSYEEMEHFDDVAKSDPLNLQALLFETSSEIIFQYKEIDSNQYYGEGKSATIGVENSNGTRTKKYSYCTACGSDVLRNGMALHMTPGSMLYEVKPRNNAITLIQPANVLSTDNELSLNIQAKAITEPGGGCKTSLGQYPNKTDAYDGLCTDHYIEGLFHDLRSKAESGDIGFRLAVMETGQESDEDGAPVLLNFNEVLEGSAITNEIGHLRDMTPAFGSPLAEALAEAMSYYQQTASPLFSNDFTKAGACAKVEPKNNAAPDDPLGPGVPDPFCDKTTGEMISCCKSFVLLIGSGYYGGDYSRNLFDDVHSDAGDNPDSSLIKDIDGAGNDEGLRSNGGWLDNVAYKLHVTDMRHDFTNDEGDDDVQDVSLYVVNTYGEGVGDGTAVLKKAATYGGFNDGATSDDNGGAIGTYDSTGAYNCDKSADGSKETGEEDKDCNGLPDTYFEPSGDASIKDKVTDAIEAMLKGSASGTSVSVLSTSAGGQGAVYQAYFYPSKIEGENETREYTGYMRAFFMDQYQNLRDDASGTTYTTDGDETIHSGKPDGQLIAKPVAEGGDYVANMHVEDGFVRVHLSDHPTGKDVPLIPAGTDHVPDPLIDELASVWEAGVILAERPKKDREIYTWADHNLDGKIDGAGVDSLFTSSAFGGAIDDSGGGGEIMLFNDVSSGKLARFLRAEDPDGAFAIISGVKRGFLNLSTEAEDIVDYVRGEYVDGYRNRCVTIKNVGSGDVLEDDPADYVNDESSGADTATAPSTGRRAKCGQADGEEDYSQTWPLGDIIYSTPTLVSGPGEKYDEIYGDASYIKFRNEYANRRNVIYVGANDGMLHAFNAGFFDKSQTKFCRGDDADENGKIDGFHYEAGKECGSIPSKGGSALNTVNYELGDELWGFVPYESLPHLAWLACNGTNGDPSACGGNGYRHVFFMDMRPKATDVKIFKDDAVHPGGWGTIIVVGMRYGGGAMNVDFDGVNGIDKEGEKIRSAYYVFDVTDPEAKPNLLYRFTDANLGFTTSYPAIARTKEDIVDGGGNVIGETDAWFVVFGSGPKNEIGLKDDYRDYNSDTTTTQAGHFYVYELGGTGQSRQFTTDAGTLADINVIMGDPSVIDVDLDFSADVIYVGSSISETNGKIYRINTGATPNTLASWPDMTVLFQDTASADPMGALFTPPSASMDSIGNLWLFFGTGRLRYDKDTEDKRGQRFYAIKEDCWEDAVGAKCTATGPNSSFELGQLYKSDEIEVDLQGVVTEGGEAACGGAPCDFDTLLSFSRDLSKKGWYYELAADGTNPSERVLARSAVLDGVVMFTTYTPKPSSCKSTGTSNLYALYYETGTATEQAIFGDEEDNEAEIQKKIFLGEGMPTAIGVAVGETVVGFVQKSTGEIVRVKSVSQYHSQSATQSWREKVRGGGTVEIEETYKHIVQ